MTGLTPREVREFRDAIYFAFEFEPWRGAMTIYTLEEPNQHCYPSYIDMQHRDGPVLMTDLDAPRRWKTKVAA